MSFARGAAVIALSALTTGSVDYSTTFDKGQSFQQFLAAARSRREEWVNRSREATVAVEEVARVRQLPAHRRLLVVAEDWCGDSVNTLPYLAKLAEAAPEALDLRIVDASIGRPIMEEHRTPDGRAATPIVVVLDDTGKSHGAWVERPSALQTWFISQQDALAQAELLARKYQWYEEDQGKSTIREVVDLLSLQR
jgi:thioredoxin family protein